MEIGRSMFRGAQRRAQDPLEFRFSVGGDALVRSIIPAEARFAFGRLRITLDDRFPTIREECP